VGWGWAVLARFVGAVRGTRIPPRAASTGGAGWPVGGLREDPQPRTIGPWDDAQDELDFRRRCSVDAAGA
jgi:hypothetical protein